MKIKLFIVTYDNKIDLNNNLSSLFSSNFENHKIEIFIINNHSNLEIDKEYLGRVHIYNNSLRPDFSTGHLSRNWNQAIINGFKDLNNPDADIVIHCQDDTIFQSNWVNDIVDLHLGFNFIQMGIGDNFCSYTPEAVKKVGLWDERFANLGYQEADYFLRQLIYNRSEATLNDHQHGRLLNPLNFSFCERPAPPNIFSEHHKKSMNFHSISEKIFRLKWGNINANYWDDNVYKNTPLKSNISSFIYYPYFEKNIIDLAEKGYVI